MHLITNFGPFIGEGIGCSISYSSSFAEKSTWYICQSILQRCFKEELGIHQSISSKSTHYAKVLGEQDTASLLDIILDNALLFKDTISGSSSKKVMRTIFAML